MVSAGQITWINSDRWIAFTQIEPNDIVQHLTVHYSAKATVLGNLTKHLIQGSPQGSPTRVEIGAAQCGAALLIY